MDLQTTRGFQIKRDIFYTPILLLAVIILLLLQHQYSITLSSQTLNGTNSTSSQHCDLSNGRWVRDPSRMYQFYTENCPFLDPGFRCHHNGRMDVDFLRWRWQPQSCTIPRFNATNMLEKMRNKRVVFAGDSIGRNQWESLLCMLAEAVSNKSSIYEENGRPITKHKGFLSMRFSDYNLTIEYYRTPYLVSIGRPPPNSSTNVHAALMIDQLHRYSQKWAGADILVFNAGHWWNQEKTTQIGTFFHQKGVLNHTMDPMEAFRRSLKTLKAWAIQSVDPAKTRIFWRSYSPLHYRGGTWDRGGRCDGNYFSPEMNKKNIGSEPENNKYVHDVINSLRGHNGSAWFLNITYLSELRSDGHPSIHREAGIQDSEVQDCSHWCLPGLPDTWNELLYSHLLDTWKK